MCMQIYEGQRSIFSVNCKSFRLTLMWLRGLRGREQRDCDNTRLCY